MFLDIVKAFIIGICASAPLGPAAILVMQKSLSYGPGPGFCTGLGATTVDTACAILAIFALAFTQNFIAAYDYLIYLAGGAIIVGLGISMAFKDPFRKLKGPQEERGASIKDYFQAVATAASNPGAVFVMLALFAFFNVDSRDAGFRLLPLVLAVAGGSMTYWFCFSHAFGKMRKIINIKALVWMSRGAGLVLMIIGIALVGEGFYRVVFG